MRSRWRAATVAVAVAGVLVAGLSGTAAQAAGSGAITGIVVDPSGDPVSDVSVEATRVGGGEEPAVVTDDDGVYTISGLAAGQYMVRFNAGVIDGLLSEWYDGAREQSDAALVTVIEGSTSTAPASLFEGATISGRVIDGETLSTVEYVEVTAFVRTSSGESWVQNTTTDSEGHYEFTGLWPGAYRISFESYEVPLPALSTYVDVRGGDHLIGVNAELGAAGVVSGRVTDGDHRAVADATVYFYPSDADSTALFARTDEDGAYAIDVPDGEYALYIDAPFDGNLADEWWDGAATRSAASLVGIFGSAATNVNADLAAAASISGTIADAFGAVADLPVYAYPADCESAVQSAVVRTEADGSYLLPGLLPGSYRVRLGDEATTAYAPRWLGGTSCATATTVVLGAGEATIDADATIGETLSGKVLGVGGVGLRGVSVQVHPPAGDDPAAVLAPAATTTSSTGAFSVRGLPRGTYQVAFGQTARPGTYIAEWWKDATSAAVSTPVKVTAGETPASLTATLALTPVTVATPKITGTAQVGVRLTASAAPTGTTYAYRWSANGAAISGATSRTFTPGAAQRGKTITVRVTASRTGYASASKTSAATAAVRTGVLVTATPRISGTVKVGRKLSVARGTWTSGTTFTYRWYAGGTAIRGATASTLTLTKAHKGKTITVKVTGKKSGYATVTRTSKATARVG